MKNDNILNILDVCSNLIEERDVWGYKICKVKSVVPLIFNLDGIDIGTSLGDKIYIHPLFISELIHQDENSIFNLQNFNQSSAYLSPNFSAKIEGDLPEFLKEFYIFYKKWQSVFLLNNEDYVVMLELGNNRYIVLQKVIEHKGEKN